MTATRPFLLTSSLLAAAALTLLASTARAEPTAPVSDDVQHNVSLTVSPIHLVSPVGELTAEFRAMDELGAALILGYGAITTSTTVGTSTNADTFSVFEVGASARYYVLGSFIHGMQLGAEVLYVYVSGDNLGGGTVSGAGDGLSVGPFIGYKIATNVGFTFDAQLGAAYVAAGAEASDNNGTSASASDTTTTVLLNLNVGWSFQERVGAGAGQAALRRGLTAADSLRPCSRWPNRSPWRTETPPA